MSHLTQSNRDIAAPIQECIHMLLRTGMREEVGQTQLILLIVFTFKYLLSVSSCAPSEDADVTTSAWSVGQACVLD